MSKANARQVGGKHYDSRYQHWDFAVRGLANRYLESQVTRYVARWRKKNGVEDLRKALHYLDKLREEFIAGHVAGLGDPIARVTSSGWSARSELARFADANGLNVDETLVFAKLLEWQTVADLDAVAEAVERLIRSAT